MPKINQVILRVTDPDAQVAFYCDVLGMTRLGVDLVGYGGDQAAIRFVQAEMSYAPERSDLYWKIALSVPDIELAGDQLRSKGVACSDPHQFEDVGYLAHFSDPEGFAIELIDHAFQADPRDPSADLAKLGGGAHLSLVTLRVPDLAAEPALVDWGMRKLSVQPIRQYGFTLHFYGFTDETPPEADLEAVANRTWVYLRPYTVLELQQVEALQAVTGPAEGAAGYDGLVIQSDAHRAPLEDLQIRWATD